MKFTSSLVNRHAAAIVASSDKVISDPPDIFVYIVASEQFRTAAIDFSVIRLSDNFPRQRSAIAFLVSVFFKFDNLRNQNSLYRF